MAWTTLRTWNPGETVTATWLNQQIRDNMNVLKTNISDTGLLLTALYMDGAARTGSGTGETDASTYTLTAGKLATTGMSLLITAWGKTAAGASTRTIKLYWNGTSVFTTTTTVASGIWQLDAVIMRTGSSLQSIRTGFGAVTLGLNTATPATIPNIGTVWDTPNADMVAGTPIVKTTLQDSAAGTNVTQLGFSIQLLTAA